MFPPPPCSTPLPGQRGSPRCCCRWWRCPGSWFGCSKHPLQRWRIQWEDSKLAVTMLVCFTYLSAGSQLYSLLCGHTVAGVEYGCRGNGSEHGHVLQAHQRRAFFTCRTITDFHISHSEMDPPVKHGTRVCWRMQICVHMQCSTCTGSLLIASRGDKKVREEGDWVLAVRPKGLSEGKHRIRGNKRIANTSRWHICLLGIVQENWRERDGKVNLVGEEKRGRQSHSSPVASH